MGVFSKLWTLFFPDRRSEAEITRERQFIEAVNSLKTLRTTDRGGMSIDLEEIRDQVLESREALKYLVDPANRKVKEVPPGD
ncbi:hypothetical protein FPB55_12805 [Pseudomonas sp. BJP69]|nr:hypothetical protein FPB55_12805 [Pseudomonas sp. BJP69]SUD79092.1 Uncharacterised protein [Pseudomonas putida]